MRAPKSIDPRYWLRRWKAGDFDRRYGTDTQFTSPLREKSVGLSSVFEDHHGFTTTKEIEPAVRAISDSPIQISESIFVDLGCGKGRIVLEAMRLPFRSIIGVELSQDMARIATNNVKKFILRDGLTKCSHVDIVIGDAATIEMPSGPLIVFMYHPFGESTMRSVRDNIRRRSDVTFIVYSKAVHAELFDEDQTFVRQTAPEGIAAWLTTQR